MWGSAGKIVFDEELPSITRDHGGRGGCGVHGIYCPAVMVTY